MTSGQWPVKLRPGQVSKRRLLIVGEAAYPLLGNPQLLCHLRHRFFAGSGHMFKCMQTSVRSNVQSYRDLVVWKKAMALVLEVYRITQTFPRTETYGLVSQLRGRPSRFQVTSRKGKGGCPPESFGSS